MSSTDNRIVSMQFDNARFEQNLQATIQSLDKLRASLDFTNSKRGLQDLSTASNNFKMEGMGQAIDGISAKFLAMASAGIATITNLTNRVVDAGARMVKAFTVAPIFDGFREFELNANSIQTILANTASKGTNLAQVGEALQKLNEYSDKTIYNFGQMAKNIGTFTAAGVDLDTSVNSIKGIANLAAVSGSSAEQAAGAMYQLSQAVSSGTFRIRDLLSVETAGMGGEVFKTSLFETAKALGTLEDVPLGQTFKEWEKANGSFRESLESGWVTSDVLTTAFSTFTGDMTDAQLAAKGFTKDQITNIQKMAKMAVGAATEVKTFTQLMSTVKEAVGTGWADTFRIVVGDFEEAKQLFTGIYNSISGFVNKTSDARNKLLEGWDELGGRKLLIESFKKAIEALKNVVMPIKEAFRQIFPEKTAQDLLVLTAAFYNFANNLILSKESMDKLKRIFAGVFAIMEIGWTVVKELYGVFKLLVQSVSPAGSGLFDFAANAGDMAVKLNQALVAGGGIHKFFTQLKEAIVKPIEFLKEFIANVKEFVSIDISDNAIEKSLGRIESRTDHLVSTWDRGMDRLQGFFNVLDKIWDVIADWFGSLGDKIAAAFEPGDFDAAVDIVNVGLLGGIALMLRKFIQQGLKLNFGGITDKIGNMIDVFTNKAKVMQTNVKANILLKIAGAMALLTASLVVLSLINSGALTKALTAMAVGFGQIVLVMLALDKGIGGIGGAPKLAIIATALVGMAGAMLILSGAIKVLSTIDPGALAAGVGAMGASLGILVGATLLLSTNAKGLLAASTAMTIMSGALVVVSGVVKIFSTMSVEELARGIGAMAASLATLVGATLLMSTNPAGLIAGTAAIVGMAGALLAISGVVKIFSLMSLEELGKGLGTIAASLAILIGATYLMSTNPSGLIAGAAAMVLMAGAMNIIAGAVLLLGQAGIDTLAKGVGAITAVLVALSIALNVMNGTIGGAAALVVAAGALSILAGVLTVLGQLSIAQIATGLGALAAVLALLGIAANLLTPLLPALLGMGVAIGILGAGFALFGTGVMFIAKAFEILAESGAAGAKAIVEILKVLVTARLVIIKAFAEIVIGLAEELLSAVPLLVRLMEAIMLQLLETIIKLVPEIAKAISVIVVEGLKLIRELFPDILATGIELMLTFLRGIRDNIGEIATIVTDIIVGFIDAISNNINRIVDAGGNLIFEFLVGIGREIGDIIAAGVWILDQILVGLANGVLTIGQRITDIVVAILGEIAKNSTRIATAGADFLIMLLDGIASNAGRVSAAVVIFVDRILTAISEAIIGATNAIARVMVDFLNGMAEAIERAGPNIRAAAGRLAMAILDGMTGGLAGGALDLFRSGADAAGNVVGGIVSGILPGSPSKVTTKLGKAMADGLAKGLREDKSAVTEAGKLADRTVERFREQLSKLSNLEDIDAFNPTITPVVDLTKVEEAGREMTSILKTSSLKAEASLNRARLISSATQVPVDNESNEPTGPTEVKFEQNIFAPKPLSTNDIYRNTKSQIALAKEELGIK